MAESVRVICRCRPFNQREIKLASKPCVEMDPAMGQCILQSSDGPPKAFTFDGVYYLESTSEQIYNDIVFPLVESVVEGYNGTVFAYGQTGSGKTYTMQGDDKTPTQRGIIPRTFEQIYESIATTSLTKFLVHVSYLEIYNEEIRDLLGENRQQKLDIKERGDRGVYVAGLSMHVCHDVKDCLRLMDTGFNNRHVGATLMNKDSSRSHSIFTIYVEALSDNGSIRMGKLNLVDLAGSERQAKTGATGERFKEATKINLSLSALGNVISALVDGKSTHIPYRDSKLTRLLQDSLGGNTKTVMVACISPSDNNYDETLSTLRYANRAKNIKNLPRINEDPKDALLREYQAEIERLKEMMHTNGPTAAAKAEQSAASNEEVEAMKQRLQEEFAQSMAELRASYENEQKSKAKLEEDLAALKQQYEKATADVEAARKADRPLDEAEARKRLEQLEQQLVGGEQANNEALKQKRMKRMREAQKKMQKLAEALNVHKDDPLLHVYSSTQDKLNAITKEYNREVERVRALESEIHDLQGEFELDRLDYLETIRKQDQQLKLFHQILERVQPAIRKDSNYADLARVKRDAHWNEEQSRWILPDLQMAKGAALPPGVAVGVSPGAVSNGNEPNGAAHFVEDDFERDSRLKKRLEQSMEQDFVNSYFKPTSKANIVNKYAVDRHKSSEKSNFLARNAKAEGLLNGVVYTDDLYDNSTQLHKQLAQQRANSGVRKPQRLEALTARANKSFT
ncbi:Kinesin domain containing protein [Aphelenchoides fujianensis]|nr:Kinesin domain containing protein [Aphelenchoides fujianensis]